VVVTDIVETGIAAGVVMAGDLIIAVNQSRISGANDFFLRLAASVSAGDTSLYLIREAQTLRVNLPALSSAQ
jgi:S1-C subfamily serine protease